MSSIINRKHEMFWNYKKPPLIARGVQLTVNMKCFEIGSWKEKQGVDMRINRKHEMFWNCNILFNLSPDSPLTVNMKCFEM